MTHDIKFTAMIVHIVSYLPLLAYTLKIEDYVRDIVCLLFRTHSSVLSLITLFP